MGTALTTIRHGEGGDVKEYAPGDAISASAVGGDDAWAELEAAGAVTSKKNALASPEDADKAQAEIEKLNARVAELEAQLRPAQSDHGQPEPNKAIQGGDPAPKAKGDTTPLPPGTAAPKKG